MIFSSLSQSIQCMLWVLKRTVSMRRFFRAPKTHIQTNGLANIYNIKLIFLSKPMVPSSYAFDQILV